MASASASASAMEEASDQQSTLVLQVEKALYQLYQDPNPTNQKAADGWLQSLQCAPQAWEVSGLLLQHQSVEVQNFGALMLRRKIARAWSELPQDQYGSLRLELFKAIARFSGGPKVVLIQLCRALAAYAFNTMPDLWPNAVVSMIHSLRAAVESTPNASFSVAVLQLLTILPEEFEDTMNTVVAAKRGILRLELQGGLQTVLSLMEEVLSSTEPNSVKIEAMKCCSSWVQFGLPLPEVSVLVDHLFRSLLTADLFLQACDTLTDIVSHDSSFKYRGALRKCMQRVLRMRDHIRAKLEEGDTEDCLALCKLVQSVAVANMDQLVGLSEDSEQEVCVEAVEMAQTMLEFLSLPGCYPVDEQCSEVTFHFWDDFLEQVASAEPKQSRYLLEFYCSVISSLIEVFPEKAQYPPDHEWEDCWTDDDQDSFVKYREDLCDLAECLQRTMHIEYLQHLSTLLSSLLSPSSTPAWQSVEAVLFLLQGVASNVTQPSTPLLQNILSLFPRMPPHPTLVQTALSLLGYLSSWFRHHVDLLQAVLPIILRGLSQPALASRAALAFRDVCGECAEQLSPFVLQIIPACQAGLANPSLEPRDCVRLVAAIGTVLSSMPVKDLVPALESLIGSRMQALQSLAMEEPTEAQRPQVEKELAVLSALCHHIYPTLLDGEQHPVVLLLVQLWPSLQALISKWCTDQEVVDSICICWNRAMRTVHKQYAPLLEGTVELIVKCFAAVHYPKLLDSAAQIVGMFGKESSCSNLLLVLLRDLHSLCLPLFQSALSDYSDIVQAYLGLMSAALKTCPLVLLQLEGIAASIFEIGLAGLKLPEQPTVTAASAFLVEFIRTADSLEPLKDTLAVHGASLVRYVLQAVGGAAPRSYLGAFSDILGALSTHCISVLSQWLEELLAQEGFPTQHVSALEKQQFKSTVLREKSNKRILKEKVKEFAIMCRGFHGTLYAAETL